MLERVLLLDGGMGTQILERRPTADDFGGAAFEGCLELLCERRPDWIREIHAAYFAAGADAVETHSFGANAMGLAEYGLADQVETLNRRAAELAREVARQFPGPRFVIGSLGPGGKLPTLGQVAHAELFRSYAAQARGLLSGGADALLLETCQDLGQVKTAVRALRAAMAELQLERPLWVQVTVEPSGTLLLGTEIAAVIATLEMLPVDLLGLNCGTGPDEMRGPLSTLAESWPLALSCQPNAGLPVNAGGRLVHPPGPEVFARKTARLVKDFGLNVAGGCCGTTPAHIRALREALAGHALTHRTPVLDRSAASLYQAVSLRQEPRPLIVGERTNAQGSRAFRACLEQDDYDGMASIAREQQREGAHMLDLCVATAGRDEARDLEELVKRVALQSRLPLMLDSTDPAVLARALALAPGKCVVNSIHFEEGEAKARRVLDLCREHGAAVVGLCIDESGMARTAGRKLEVARRLVDLAVGDFGFNPSDLILDPLTFTLASGGEESRRSALETLEALAEIKARFHGVLTLLGVSNVSFGLKPAARHALNALMLVHAVRYGLDLAIFNAAWVTPLSRLPEDVRRAGEDLIHDRRREGHDPLHAFLACFEGPARDAAEAVAVLDPEARLRRDLLEGDRARIAEDVDAALRTSDPVDLLNRVLLGAMQELGRRFGAGELQLPFVLAGAEAMKAAVARLRPHLPRGAEGAKGRVLLATVKGDVHDIGKNLVGILLENNGWEVEDLGIQVPPERLAEALEARPAAALGLSGLLVKSTAAMRDSLQVLAERGHRLPVLLGGAALTRGFVAEVCQPAYGGAVHYAADAFDGLQILEGLRAGEAGAEAVPSAQGTSPEVGVALDSEGRSSWVRRPEALPRAPFLGVRGAEPGLQELFDWLDTFVVMRHRWAFTQGALDDAAYEALLREKAQPLLEAWKVRLLAEPILRPRARYGFFRARSRGDALELLAPEGDRVLRTLRFPRQPGGRRLCVADFFEPAASEREDVAALQLVTLGPEASAFASRLHAEGRYADYFAFHGLATELTEACAEWMHARIRRELGIHGMDAPRLRQRLAQGYQGSRFSFGYPACPSLEANGELLALLEGGTLGVALTETFQMVPEFSTCALVASHPQARYFAV